MGWIRLVGSLKLYLSLAKEPCKRDDILQKRPIILRSLLIVATPYCNTVWHKRHTLLRNKTYTGIATHGAGCVYVSLRKRTYSSVAMHSAIDTRDTHSLKNEKYTGIATNCAGCVCVLKKQDINLYCNILCPAPTEKAFCVSVRLCQYVCNTSAYVHIYIYIYVYIYEWSYICTPTNPPTHIHICIL